jgi:hypothetical protein
MLAVTYVATKASHAGRVKGNRPDKKKRHPGPPGWGMGHEADNLIHVKNINCSETLDDSLGNIGWTKISVTWHVKGTKNWNMDCVDSA